MQGFSRVRLHSFGKKLLIILKLNDGADVVVGVLVDVDADAPIYTHLIMLYSYTMRSPSGIVH